MTDRISLMLELDDCPPMAWRPWAEAIVRNLATPNRTMSETPIPASAANEADTQRDLRESLNGEGEAYARIIRRYQDTLGRRMFRFSRDPAQVAELVHDVFVEAYFSLKQYRADAPFEHWLQAIATRVGYRFWKRRRQDREHAMELMIHPPADRASATPDESSETVAALLERLPPRDRLVVTLLYLEERSVAEAARMAGWSQTMVKVQAFRARGKLRKLLTQYEQQSNRAKRQGETS